MTQPAAEELLVQEANKERRWQRSGKLMSMQAGLILVFFAVGCWLVFGVRSGATVHHVAMIIGIVAFVIAVILVHGAVDLSPAAPWGNAVRGRCPRCGHQKLREHTALHWEAPGSGKSALLGTVTLCTADCGYAAVRDIKVNADGGLV